MRPNELPYDVKNSLRSSSLNVCSGSRAVTYSGTDGTRSDDKVTAKVAGGSVYFKVRLIITGILPNVRDMRFGNCRTHLGKGGSLVSTGNSCPACNSDKRFSKYLNEKRFALFNDGDGDAVSKSRRRSQRFVVLAIPFNGLHEDRALVRARLSEVFAPPDLVSQE